MQPSPRFPRNFASPAGPRNHFTAHHAGTSPMVFPHLRPVDAPPPGYPHLSPAGRPHLGCPPRFQPPPIMQHSVGPRFHPGVHHPSERGRGRGFRNQRGGARQFVSKSPAVQKIDKLKLLCESCDRSFPDDAALKEHIDSHEICGVEGCQFSAHPKIIIKHREAQHDSGLYKRLILGTNPEEVALWKEERRKRFPTRANIELKREAEEARQARGERIHCPRGRFNRRGNWQQRPVQSFQSKLPPQSQPDTAPSHATPSEQTSVLTSDTVISKKNEVSTTMAPPLPSAIAGLASCYATSSSDEDSDAAPREISTKTECNEPLPPAKKVRVETISPKQFQKIQQPTFREKYAAHRRPPTLLQKLLETEIVHERNVILQCVRHVVQNKNFNC